MARDSAPAYLELNVPGLDHDSTRRRPKAIPGPAIGRSISPSIGLNRPDNLGTQGTPIQNFGKVALFQPVEVLPRHRRRRNRCGYSVGNFAHHRRIP